MLYFLVSMVKSPLIIAIDGPSGTGKSTTAQLVAKRLGILYLDSGALYRAISWKANQFQVKAEDSESLRQLLKETTLSFDQDGQVVVDGVSRATEVRDPSISAIVSHFAALKSVRAAVTSFLQAIGMERSAVLDGRDIGTVVFPRATYKFFLQADYGIRAQRRQLELKAKGIEVPLAEVEANLRERDRLDSERGEAPLRRAEDAIDIDTTYTTIEEQVEQVCGQVRVVANP